MAFLNTGFLPMRGRNNCHATGLASNYHIYKTDDLMATVQAAAYFPAYLAWDAQTILENDILIVMASDLVHSFRLTNVSTTPVLGVNIFGDVDNYARVSILDYPISWTGPGNWTPPLSGGFAYLVFTGTYFSASIPGFQSGITTLPAPIQISTPFEASFNPLETIRGAINYVQGGNVVAGYYEMTPAGELSVYSHSAIPPGAGNWGFEGFTINYLRNQYP